jgi:hypothetical protein
MNRFKSADNGSSRFSNLKSSGPNVFLSGSSASPREATARSVAEKKEPTYNDKFPSFSKTDVKPKNTFVNQKDTFVNQKDTFVNQKDTFVNQKDTFVNQKDTFVNQKDTFVNQKIDDEFPSFSKSISVVKANGSNEAKLSYNKAITTAEKIKEERVREEFESNQNKRVVKPGWVCFYKNPQTGKTVTEYGPKTEYEKQKEKEELLKNNLKYQMHEAITRLSERWEEEKEAFDKYHWPGAFEEKYGYVSTYPEDDDDEDYNEDDSDYDSE